MSDLGAVIAMIVLGIGGLVLVGLAVMMMIGAIIPKRGDITSWPPPQEVSFAPFNNRALASHGQAWMFSIIGGVAMFIIIVGIYFGVAPEVRDFGKSMNMSNLTKKANAPAPAPKADAPKADAPKTDAPAEKPAEKTDAPKTDAPKTDAPK